MFSDQATHDLIKLMTCYKNPQNKKHLVVYFVEINNARNGKETNRKKNADLCQQIHNTHKRAYCYHYSPYPLNHEQLYRCPMSD